MGRGHWPLHTSAFLCDRCRHTIRQDQSLRRIFGNYSCVVCGDHFRTFRFYDQPQRDSLFKEFGLILFVYSVGMQVGPGFFSSFKQGGITLNMLACGIVFLGVLTAVILHYATGIPMPTMVGILSGAVTNTPGLGLPSKHFPICTECLTIQLLWDMLSLTL